MLIIAVNEDHARSQAAVTPVGYPWLFKAKNPNVPTIKCAKYGSEIYLKTSHARFFTLTSSYAEK